MRRPAILADRPQFLLLLLIAQNACRMTLILKVVHESLSSRGGFRDIVATELGNQPAVALGQQLSFLMVQMLALDEIDEELVDALKADRPIRQRLGYAIRRTEDVREANDRHHALPRAGDEFHRRLQDGDAGPFGPDQRAGRIESILRQQSSRFA